MENWLCKAYTVLQILWSATYLQQYLQRYNYLLTSELHAFGCRWQMFLCFFNFIEEGLRIKIRVTTVIINQIHLCALRVLCGENSAKMNYSIK